MPVIKVYKDVSEEFASFPFLKITLTIHSQTAVMIKNACTLFSKDVRHTHVTTDETAGDTEQRLLRPREAPVYGRVVDDGGEVSATRAQQIAHWTHRQAHVQIVADEKLEELPHAVLGRRETGSGGV